jgi:23S rRNA (cytosine1962-C5)-methyltransferase
MGCAPVTPCVIFEDEHLLVANKPAGLNTHAPSPYAGEGLYDWLRQREARWGEIGIVQRLDKETSGVIVFPKTSLAKRSLTDQFTHHAAGKKYVLVTDRFLRRSSVTAVSEIARAGDKYVSRPLHAGGERAETRFTVLGLLKPEEIRQAEKRSCQLIQAEPVTGRTHQIRVHAQEHGFPILGDTLYGGTPAARVFLHAVELSLHHPVTEEPMVFSATPAFADDPRLLLRRAVIDPADTNACRLIHGAADGWPGWYVDRLGEFLLSQSCYPEQSRGTERPLDEARKSLLRCFSPRGVYHKQLARALGRRASAEASPQPVMGAKAPERFTVRENSVSFELSFQEGYSTGLFLDQRDNRRRLLTGHVAAGFSLFQSQISDLKSQIRLLNLFAYTCGFSVCAAKAGMHTTSIDLSRKSIAWGKRNFILNGLDPTKHDFIYGDAFDWLRRLSKKGRRFDVILLDPPTFSRSKEHGAFQVQKDLGPLVATALPLLNGGGVLFASTNAADWAPTAFLAAIRNACAAANRRIVRQHYVPQPPDFPVIRDEPAYLKTIWLQIA